MKQEIKLLFQLIDSVSLAKRMLTGAGLGLILITVFVFSVDDPNPAWGKLWMLRPLLVVSFAGALGGLCNYFLEQFHRLIGLNRSVALALSVVVFIIGLWLGSVLGLAGTLWD